MLKRYWDKTMNLPGKDPDDVRRKKLINYLLLGIFTSALVGFIVTGVGLLFLSWKFTDVPFLLVTCVVFIIGSLIIYTINRKSGITAGILLLVLLTISVTFSDTPFQVAEGRSLYFFSISIAVASLLIHPLASFAFAIISAVIISAMAVMIDTVPNIPAIIGFFMLALIAWLSARSLQEALNDLRQTNANLDILVQERTKELANALTRERIDAGRTKAILESIADGVIVFDLRGKAIIANPSTGFLLELDHNELLGSTIDDLSQSKYLDSFSRGILHNLLLHPGGKSNSYHVEWNKKTLSVTSAEVLDREGEPLGTVAVFRDYTHEAEVEKMKNTFLAIVSHELRTPLNAILGYAEMLKEAVYGPVNEKQARAADRIMTNSHRLLDIVSDLLDKAQMEAGKLSLHLQAFRPIDLIDNVHSVMDKIAGDKGLALTSELDPELPEYIIGDIARLQQILVNLINNSVKFTEKGSVHICLSRPDKKHWQLGITDTGIGIPDEELPNIFEAFRQVDSTATRKYGGFGLGLSIVKQLSELMDGQVTVSSQLGTGSNFNVILPLIQAKRSGK
jgi:PAS domain S-box-containing protein